MTTKIKPLNLEIGVSASFFSEVKNKNIQGIVVKINNKTVVLEVKKERTVIEKVKSLLGKFGKDKEKKSVITVTKHIKKRLNQLVA